MDLQRGNEVALQCWLQRSTDEAQHMLKNLSKGTVLATHVEIATTFLARMRGLLFRRRLEPDHCLILDHSPAIHMWFMLFSIDVVFLDEDRQVLAVFPNRRPFSLPVFCTKARYAAELTMGSIQKSLTEPGDQLTW